jgi:hypothetical protein
MGTVKSVCTPNIFDGFMSECMFGGSEFENGTVEGIFVRTLFGDVVVIAGVV